MAGADDTQRLVRVEEHLGFAEHALEQLSAEIAAVNTRLKKLTDRLSMIEARLDNAHPSEDPDHE